MGEPAFSDVIDWLAEREGDSAYIEAGMSDPTLAGSDFCLLALHVRLGKLQIVEDIGHERGMASLPLDGQEVPDLFAVRCWTAIEVLPGPNSKCESTARKLEKHAYV